MLSGFLKAADVSAPFVLEINAQVIRDLYHSSMVVVVRLVPVPTVDAPNAHHLFVSKVCLY